MGESILNSEGCGSALAARIFDRDVEDFYCYVRRGGDGKRFIDIKERAVVSGGDLVCDDESVGVVFSGGEGVYQFRYKLSQAFLASGVGVRFRLREWKSIKYVAIGYTVGNKFRHVKISNCAAEAWVEFFVGHKDIAWGLQNDWEAPQDEEISDIRVYIKGEAQGSGSKLDVAEMCCWREFASDPTWLQYNGDAPEVSKDLLDIIYKYLAKCFRSFSRQAHAFMVNGDCPLYGDVLLDWAREDQVPESLKDVGTYRFSWHSLHPATILMLESWATGAISPLFAAREMVCNWLDKSFFSPDLDKKFAWYDHGAAERLIAMVLMWSIGQQHGFDQRFMTRLRFAIFKHAQLLDSELFYASHQASRYHNHAWFQDLALLTTSLAMSDFPCASHWSKNALERLADQLNVLIVRDNGFAVFVENSIGYHQGVQRLVEFAGDLVGFSGKEGEIPKIAVELQAWSDYLKYPDNRSPAQGDTFRRANLDSDLIRRGKPYLVPECKVLPKAGYAVVKGNHEGVPFMLCMFATSLCRTHKHEDNLSFVLFFDGIEWFIDPSFYSHEYALPVQKYLRSAWGHNNVVVAGRDYSIDPGHAFLSGDSDDALFRINASHDAFSGVNVHRSMSGSLRFLDFELTDKVEPVATADRLNAYRFLHLGENVSASVSDDGILLAHPDSDYALLVSGNISGASVYKGWSQDSEFHGVTGLGFMEKTDIEKIVLGLAPGVEASIRVSAVRK